MALPSDRKQEIHLFIDKVRGLMKFVGKPRPPLPEYEETTRIFCEEIEKETKSLIGQFMTPAHIAATVAISKRAIQHAQHLTGFELVFSHHMVDPGDFEDAENVVFVKRSGTLDQLVAESLAQMDEINKHDPLIQGLKNRPPTAVVVATEAGPTTVTIPESDREELIKLLEEVVDDAASYDMGSDLRERIEAKIGREGKRW